MGLAKYVAKRLIQIVPVLLSVIVINFLLIHAAPGDIASFYAGQEVPSPEEIAAIRQRYGLDQPLWTQFALYIGNILRGDLGESWKWQSPVLQVILGRLPQTFLLIATSLIFSLIFGIFLGSTAARKRHTKFDLISSTTFLALYSTPVFWGGLILILIFSLYLRLLPTSGMAFIGPEAGLDYYLEVLRHLILPALTLSIFSQLGVFFRITRSSVLEVIGEDFVKTAESVGYNEKIVYRKHVLRNALLPVITVAGHQMGHIFSGAMITETVFAWPGMGRLTYEAILGRDIPLIIGSYIIGSICVVIANLVVDIIYTFVDPRIKLE